MSGHSRIKLGRPVEELLEVHAQPNYQQFISGLPKNASATTTHEQKSDVSTMLTSACDDKMDSISI